MTVHSTQLGADLTLGTGATTLYTVPAGKRTIVKSIVVCNGNAAANFVGFGVIRAGVTIANFRYFVAATSTSGDTVSDLPWIVLNAGDQLLAQAHLASVSVIVSGAELGL